MDSEGLVSDLKRFTSEKDLDGIEDALNKLSIAENLQSVETLKETFLELLIQNTPNINLLVSKTIAEITKNQEQRTKFSNNEVLEKLNELLGVTLSSRKQPGNIELLIQLCRALGNIFYSNDDARNIIFHLDGGKTLVELFDVSSNEVNSDQMETFARVRIGVMSNYLLGNEELSQKAIELGIIDKVKLRMEEINQGHENLLPLFSILTEQVSDLIFKPEILTLITNILKNSSNVLVDEFCLELLQCQAESDEVKLLLAKEGLCEHILKTFHSYMTLGSNDETKSLVKLVCDLIVLILTGDEAMHELEKTTLLAQMKSWLESDDVDLITTSVLAIGNFARTDENCIKMVEDHLHYKLIYILSMNSEPEADSRLQHALLSAIRNLVIAQPNKVAVIEAGLVQVILPMIATHQAPIVFKLLGTLRMLTDGQCYLALELLENKTLIEQLVEWARNSPDMVGVNSEASRLMASIIKHGHVAQKSKDYKCLKSFVEVDGSVDTLVKMLLSAHLVMQNEAIIALTLLVLLVRDQKLCEILIASNIGQTLVDFIQRISDMERTSNEILENLRTFLKPLLMSEELKKHLSNFDIEEKLKIVPEIKELATL